MQVSACDPADCKPLCLCLCMLRADFGRRVGFGLFPLCCCETSVTRQRASKLKIVVDESKSSPTPDKLLKRKSGREGTEYVPFDRLKRLPLRDRDLGRENASTNGQRDAGRGGRRTAAPRHLRDYRGLAGTEFCSACFCRELLLAPLPARWQSSHFSARVRPGERETLRERMRARSELLTPPEFV